MDSVHNKGFPWKKTKENINDLLKSFKRKEKITS